MSTEEQSDLVTYPAGLAGLPEDVRAVAVEFWRGLAPTEDTAACPDCGAGGLPVRSAEQPGGQTWRYVAHCDDVRQL